MFIQFLRIRDIKERFMELSLLVIFWYGILHAFGPDHLTAIADFSIGKDKRKTLLITTLFAIGHGLSLFLFAKILQNFDISEEILAYGDLISATVIMGMGLYLLFMVVTNRIHLHTHQHEGKEHVHIWFGKKHDHNQVDTTSSFTMGLLMGIGGVRGMLITLGAVQGGAVDFGMVGAFTLGVILIFVSFGMLILYINQNFLNNLRNVRGTFATAGIISLIVGMNILSF
jgi:ABC-type nickel/cobalt efflux system permease component RcnA